MRLGTSIMNVLVIDIGGTNVKILATGQQEPVKFPSGPAMNAKAMVAGVKKRTRDWKYDVISLGYPGPVLRGCPKAEPRNLAPGWV
jgi:polyphosphate glucokinase